ncbi:PhzF family phenazine biosynthesis protein [Neisseria weaveri]|uniref:Predicted epimerase, PhzC/PhzF homolog n=1 Tax=Neisseria weaveri TaxID=28091 RepID=A0A3S5B590_9NEIS|nr:PhzF family phenazine biosynthesis protein [Neisseria weaveri]VEJ51483.1 Predicted epimerase, PhzC/PhzF homolog [Neisseria weaveri]
MATPHTLHAGYACCRLSSASRVELAEATGICEAQIAEHAYWLDSGSPQLLLQVYTAAALENARIDYAKLNAVCRADSGRTMIYLWHEQDDTVQARMFYAQNGTILEDNGTGSACANLGAYYLSRGTFPLKRSVRQGDQTGRPNRLSLRVDEAENIYVGGRVVEVGRGVFKLPR